MSILDLSDKLDAGMLFRPPDDKLRIKAFIPPLGRQSRAANLVELLNDDLLCAWFARSREGVRDISIALSRLPRGALDGTGVRFGGCYALRAESGALLCARWRAVVTLLLSGDARLHVGRMAASRRCRGGRGGVHHAGDVGHPPLSLQWWRPLTARMK